MTKQTCGCEVTEELVFKPCRYHWEQMQCEYKKIVKQFATGIAHYDKRLGIKVVDDGR